MIKYRPDIDGLRALAVLAVIMFHARMPFMSGGYVGVDVFFVISGYLITSIIWTEMEAGRFSLWTFWERRIRRILPALAVVVFATLVLGWNLFLPREFKMLGQSVVANSMLSSNIYFWSVSGYFDQAAELQPLLHTWSLSLEEQYYLLYPVVLMGATSFGKRGVVLTVALVGAASFACCVWATSRYPSFAFYMLPARMWELMLGCGVALLPRSAAVSNTIIAELEAVCGLLAIGLAVFCLSPATKFPGWAALLPVVGTAMIIHANLARRTVVGKVLSVRPLVFIGLISYSAYLWHWPLLAYLNYLHPEPGAGARVVMIVVALAAAALTWRFVEQPFRTKRFCKSRHVMIGLGSLAGVVLGAIGLLVHLQKGVRERLPAEVLQYSDAVESKSPDRAMLRAVRLAEEPPAIYADGERARRLFVWGDSHLEAVLHVVRGLCEEYQVVATGLSAPGGLHLDRRNDRKRAEKRRLVGEVLSFVEEYEIPNVLMVFSWYSVNDPAEVELVRNTVTTLAGRGVKVFVMNSVPVYELDVPTRLALTARGGEAERLSIPVEEVLEKRRVADELLQELEAGNLVSVVDPLSRFVADDNRTLVQEDGKSLYYDATHLSVYGAGWVIPVLRPVFETMSEGPGTAANGAREEPVNLR